MKVNKLFKFRGYTNLYVACITDLIAYYIFCFLKLKIQEVTIIIVTGFNFN